MVDSPKRLPVAFLGNDYNNFLFASFGADRIGGQLSVVSALARLDMDPWDEAEKLARLSGDSAVQKLLIWMSRLPELSSGFDERTNTAKRLVALLPQRIMRKSRTNISGEGRTLPATLPATLPTLLPTMAAVIFLALSIMLVGRSQLHQPATPPGAAASSTLPDAGTNRPH